MKHKFLTLVVFEWYIFLNVVRGLAIESGGRGYVAPPLFDLSAHLPNINSARQLLYCLA